MPISGALPANAPFVADAQGSQRRRPDTPNDCFWQDNSITLAGSDDATHLVDEGLVLLFDGRLTRHRDLAARLGTTGNPPLFDVLHAYGRWGDQFPRYLDGVFALALWDGRHHRLILARDAGGYRPLHYWVRGDQFRFASEARGLIAHGDIRLVANQMRIAQRLSGTPETGGRTFFQDILSVPAGHAVVWERGQVSVRDFWQPLNIRPLRLADPREYAEGLRSVLEEAVRERIEGLSAAGSHLSGGLDSSSVTATAAKVCQDRGSRLTAFTYVPAISMDDARFPGAFCDESDHASATVAMYPNVDHALIRIVSGGLLENLDRMSSAAESPQSSAGNSWWIHAICADAAARGIRTVLTGARGNFTISWNGRRALSGLIASGRIPEAVGLARAMRKNGNSWRAVLGIGIHPLLPSGIRRMLISARGADGSEDEVGWRREFAIAAGLDPEESLNQMESLDCRSLRVVCIRRADPGGHTAAMLRLTGVEQIDPTADRRVMEFCLSVPEELYCEHGRGRSLIRNAMRGMLPPKVLEERRRGRQSADVVFHLTEEKAEIEAELNRLKKVDLAARCLNLPALESLVQSWPSPPYGRGEHMTHGSPLMRAISIGRFIRRLEDGTLFKDRCSPIQVAGS